MVQQSIQQFNQRAKRILCVDDHHDTLEALTRLLRKDNFEVDGHETCAAAFKGVQEGSRYDALICDMGFPNGESGLDLLTQLRQIAPLPAIAMTGYGDDVDIELTRAAGYSFHLTKPIEYPKMLAAIDALLNGAEFGVNAVLDPKNRPVQTNLRV